MQYGIIPTQQSDPDGIGPGYFLNGVTDTGYWYQIGICYNWPTTTGYSICYATFLPNGNIVGTTRFIQLSKPINPTDTVVLNLSITNKEVVMGAKDLETGASATLYPNNATAHAFEGSLSNKNGFYTGLLTEWWHKNPNYLSEQPVVYTSENQYKPKGILVSEEWLSGPSVYITGHAEENPTILFYNSTNGASVAGGDNAGSLIATYSNGTFITQNGKPAVNQQPASGTPTPAVSYNQTTYLSYCSNHPEAPNCYPSSFNTPRNNQSTSGATTSIPVNATTSSTIIQAENKASSGHILSSIATAIGNAINSFIHLFQGT
ncbi:MAG: hypothetical protein KGH60_01085 [Candidatus Micrarchaeota archaeon]|nr:hypothetical protein [Candidatus Micrarchaeota archaeon]